MPFDFKSLLTATPDPKLKQDNEEMIWAHIGRRVYENVMSDRFLTATVEANLSVLNMSRTEPPSAHIARKLRAYIFSGTITR